MQPPAEKSQQPGTVLVCFALDEEAGAFRKLAAGREHVSILITGIGRKNAEGSVREFLQQNSTRQVFTCGFAGGLNPELKIGDVVFLTLQRTVWDALAKYGARSAYFYSGSRIVTTAAEKAELRLKTRQDAVEMESAHIQAICREQKLPCTTVRVISDTAQEDLPFDFNQLCKPDLSLDFGKLAWAIVKSPGKIPALLRLRKNTNLAAERLAEALANVIWQQ